MRTVLLLKVILVSVRTQDDQDKALTKNPIENLRVIEETLQANYTNLDLYEERAKALNHVPP
jgi:hypothetical protein